MSAKSDRKLDDVVVTPAPGKKNENGVPSKYFNETPNTTPSPMIRRFSSSDMMLPTPVSPMNGGPSSLIFMNRNSDFTRTVYEVDNGLLNQIRSSVKGKPEPPALKTIFENGDASSGDSTAASTPTVAAGEPTMERRLVPPPNFTVESPAVLKTTDSKKALVEAPKTEEKDKKKKDVKPTAGGHLMIKLGILLSRSSGRDKFCAFLQYGAMFWGNQKMFDVSHARDAPWRNLEDSMSAGRKTLRLFKWIKEFERMQRALHIPDPGPHATETRTRVASVLGFLMHTFSFAYYFIDNVLYSSQIGLINRPNVSTIFELRKMLKNGLPHDEYLKLQRKFRSDESLREQSRQFEEKLKDLKNYSSLLRLLFAIVYCSLQIDSVSRAERVVESDKSMSSKDKKKQLWELGEVKDESGKELLASICNLIILLNRLKMGKFRDVPLWGVGVLGMIAALFGLDKNWPREKPVF